MNNHASKLALALFLVAVQAGTCQSITGPESITVQPGRLGTVTVTVDADEAMYEVLSKDFDAFREQTGVATQLTIKVLIPAFLPDGRPTPAGHKGWITLAAVKNGKLIRPIYKCEIIAAGVVPPPPIPPDPKPPIPPPPVPPEPKPPDPKPPEPVPVVDPLVKALQEAAANDGMPKDELSKVAKAASNASMIIIEGQTAQRAHDLIKVALFKSPPLGISLHTIVNDLTGKVFTDLLNNPNEVLSKAKAAAVTAPLVKIAKALEEAAK